MCTIIKGGVMSRFTMKLAKGSVVWLWVCLLVLVAVPSVATEDAPDREYVPLVNAQLNVKGMRGFAGRALQRFTQPAPIWNEVDRRWRSINELKYKGDQWSAAEGPSQAAYAACGALQQQYLQQGQAYRIVADFNTPTGSPLLDSALNPIVYDVLLNQVAESAITEHQSGRFAFPGQMANRDSQPSRPGAILIKFAWQIVVQDASYPATVFYRDKVLLKLPNMPSCRRTDVALLGFHVAMKPQANLVSDGTLLKSSPFTWATYLHPGVAPSYQQLAALPIGEEPQWLLFNQDKGVTTPLPLDTCPQLTQYHHACCQMLSADQVSACGELTAQIIANEECVINQSGKSGQRVSADLVQMCRRDIAADADTVAVTPALGAPWDQYEFIDIQWHPIMGQPIPATLSNPVLEPFFKAFTPPHTGNVSCFNCHQQAADTDTMFSIKSLLK
ncbi:hypothetical protein [Shewanella sp. YLB-07]|uniref:hypothetical protein n=1 Tax=Shewanella sp. YLB-07 TaxID=2601268 RepID=UPI00128B9DB1|nr:hypothetical protein [Shewanella sp. YLB-07]MPY26891.1 hypothetical protein [Shewanella sp. YLB-07]